MTPVSVRIVTVPAAPGAGPRERLIADARGRLAEVHRRRFLAAHAADAQIITDPRAMRPAIADPHTLTLEAGMLPLATAADYDRIVEAAAADRGPVHPAEPDRWRLAARIDSPLDLLLAARDWRLPEPLRADALALGARPELAALRGALADITRALVDRRAQVLVVGRERPAEPPWDPVRVRALVRWEPDPRLAMDLARPDLLVHALAPQADAAIVDTRVLLAARLARGGRQWPSLEDCLASDLLEPEAVADPWLRDLTAAAAMGGLPVLLGGPSLLAWGVRLLLTGRRRNPVRPDTARAGQ